MEILLGLAAQSRADIPILFGHERLDLALLLDDQPQGDGLHAARAQPEGELRPNERRYVVTNDAIEHAPATLGVVQIRVQVARRIDAALHALLRDLLELDAADLELGPRQLLGDVKCNRLAFAIRV